jgi:hypothetical protein
VMWIMYYAVDTGPFYFVTRVEPVGHSASILLLEHQPSPL